MAHNKNPFRRLIRHSLTAVHARAWNITAIYAVLATAWIYFSDNLLAIAFPDPPSMIRWSVYKGLAFVALTSLLLLLLMARAFRQIEKDYASRKAHEAEIKRLNRLYAARSQVNMAIARIPDRDALYQRICQVLVEYGKFQMVWIGWKNSTTGELEPVAAWGDDNDFLRQGKIGTYNLPGQLGATGIEFHNGHPFVCNDITTVPTTTTWRHEISRRGFKSAAFFPICLNNLIGGDLNVYSSSPDYFQDKEITLLEEVAMDISFAMDNIARREARRHAEVLAQSEKRFSDAMIESMPGILYFYNREGHFMRWNRNFEKVSGYSAKEIASMHPLDFFSSEDKRSLQQRIDEVFLAGESSAEASFLKKDGSQTPYFFTGRHVEFEGKDCLVGVGIDISHRKLMETELRQLNQTLEIKVSQRTAELEKALVRAEASDKLKSAFLATMSHELRTPLNSIIGFTGIVLKEMAGPLTSEQSRQLGMVQNSSRHLLELINDVLDLSKIEAGQLEVRTTSFNLPSLIERVVALAQPLADKKGLSLHYSVDPGINELISDNRRVKQILINLLNNAIKFTENGSVKLSAVMMNQYKHPVSGESCPAVAIQVEDTGIGIKPEDLDTLFKPFRQIDSGLTRQHEGTGLGLAICRRLATLLNGEINVLSKSSEGSTFSVILPINPLLNHETNSTAN